VTTPGVKVDVQGTAFTSDTVLYFAGIGARDIEFLSPSLIRATTPYLRPGRYTLEVKSGSVLSRSSAFFTALPSAVDAEIDRAVTLAAEAKIPAAIRLLTGITETYGDYQVRAFAAYQMGQIYFAQGDWWHWGGAPIYVDSDKSGLAVQTNWRYRLSTDQSDYYLPTGVNPGGILRLLDATVSMDVTENPEPRFFRGLVNARLGNLPTAEADNKYILMIEPDNPSYRALSAYVDVLRGRQPEFKSPDAEAISDGRALGLLGEAAYLMGDSEGSRRYWGRAAKLYPLGASLAFLAGKKHLAWGQTRVGTALLTECTVMAPGSKEAEEAKGLLAALQSLPP
jgi:tetratricopeptide (TPR) repeat protein